MADDTEKSGEIASQLATGRNADVSDHTSTDIHFGDLDVGNIYVLPSLDSNPTSATGDNYMLGEEGQELSSPSAELASLSMEDPGFSGGVGEFLDGLSNESELDLMLDASPSDIPVQDAVVLSEIELLEQAREGSQQLIDLDQLFDVVGATSHQSPFGDAPDHQVSLADTFWDDAPQEQAAAPIPELLEPIAALDPSRALDNIFESLYVADES